MNPTDLEMIYATRSVPLPALGGDYPYRLLEPAEVQPGERYPLLVFLHGAGERGTDNSAQLRYLPTWLADQDALARYPCYLLAPQCRPNTYWVETSRAFDRSAPRESPGPMMQGVLNAIADVQANFPVDESRLYLTGLSMGGYGSWDLGTRCAERWAAVAPICGGGDELYADRLVGVPVWAWHGDADDVVPVDRSRTMLEAIRRAGGSPRHTELAGVGHDSWTPAYRGGELLEWIFAQRKS